MGNHIFHLNEDVTAHFDMDRLPCSIPKPKTHWGRVVWFYHAGKFVFEKPSNGRKPRKPRTGCWRGLRFERDTKHWSYESLVPLSCRGKTARSGALASRAQFVEQDCQDDHGALDDQLPVEGYIHQC